MTYIKGGILSAKQLNELSASGSSGSLQLVARVRTFPRGYSSSIQPGETTVINRWTYLDYGNNEIEQIPDYDFIVVDGAFGDQTNKIDMIGFGCSPSLDYGFEFSVILRNNGNSAYTFDQDANFGALSFYKFG